MSKLRTLINTSLALYYGSRLRRDQWKDPHRLREIQFRKLKAIVKYAYNCIPYYHRLFSSVKFRPENLKKFDDLKRIPLTSKEEVLKNYSNIVPKGVDVSKMPSGFTSGSTGPTMQFYRDYSYQSFLDAVTQYPFFECGAKLTDTFVTVHGRKSQFVVFNRKYVILLGAIRNISVPLFPPEKLAKVLRRINPDVIWTFPSVSTTLANYDVSGINPRLIITQGEMVNQHCREVAQKSFNSELFETYGSVEFGHLAFECNEHCGLHVITDGVHLEFVDQYDECVSSGEQGEIIVTGLGNYLMPLIRYRIGDFGIPTDEKCPCERSWPLIKSIQGRTNDCLVLPSGKKIPAGWLYIERIVEKELKRNAFSISQYQFVQEHKGKITIKIVKGKEFDQDMLKTIESNVKTYFCGTGEDLDIATQVVKEIPTGRTGKRKDFVSMLSRIGSENNQA